MRDTAGQQHSGALRWGWGCGSGLPASGGCGAGWGAAFLWSLLLSAGQPSIPGTGGAICVSRSIWGPLTSGAIDLVAGKGVTWLGSHFVSRSALLRLTSDRFLLPTPGRPPTPTPPPSPASWLPAAGCLKSVLRIHRNQVQFGKCGLTFKKYSLS